MDYIIAIGTILVSTYFLFRVFYGYFNKGYLVIDGDIKKDKEAKKYFILFSIIGFSILIGTIIFIIFGK